MNGYGDGWGGGGGSVKRSEHGVLRSLLLYDWLAGLFNVDAKSRDHGRRKDGLGKDVSYAHDYECRLFYRWRIEHVPIGYLSLLLFLPICIVRHFYSYCSIARTALPRDCGTCTCNLISLMEKRFRLSRGCRHLACSHVT